MSALRQQRPFDTNWASAQLGNEIAFLKTEIYLSEVEPRLQTLTALSRFSVRA